MTKTVELRGITWEHSRGYDPMVATADRYKEIHPHVSITWERRSLQAFADRPIEDMVGPYDLLVIDHPHVGEVARTGHLLALDSPDRAQELATLADQSVGISHASYQFGEHQWALAIDAATPVAAYRSDLIEAVPKRWDDVLQLARLGKVAFALIPVNALMVFFGMARNKGFDIAQGEELIGRNQGIEILETMLEIVSLMDPRCLISDPIGIYEWMGRVEDAPAYSPFGYGYTNYSRNGYCLFPLTFADAPGFENNGPRGTVIGGTGIAVSSSSSHCGVAVDYAFWIAGAQCQKGLFFESGGQPANRVAWEDDGCNVACRDFFRNTRQTLETAWLRPRYDGYMGLQAVGGDVVHACLRGDLDVRKAWSQLQAAYRKP